MVFEPAIHTRAVPGSKDEEAVSLGVESSIGFLRILALAASMGRS